LTFSGGHSQCVDESVSICTGAFFRAEAGVLDGKRDDALAVCSEPSRSFS
jgi:hypothetical protein